MPCFFGMGAYCAAHVVNSSRPAHSGCRPNWCRWPAGSAGLFFGYVFGWLVTKQRATAFAMITMGLGELVSAAALMFMGFFGGEGGITIDRVMDTSLFGVKYTSSWQVYYLMLAWAFIAAALMRLQTQTPLGSMANAARDNFERAQFVGYDPRMVRLCQFALSGFFAGIGGGLYVLIYEIVTFDTVSAAKSANALLAVYIGGAGGFFGPILGTIVVVLLQSGVSLLSNAWLLYVGVLFIVMVMYAPGGHDRADLHACADLARRPAARTGAALCAGTSAGAVGAAGLRAAGRTGVLHYHRRRAGQEVLDRRPPRSTPRRRCHGSSPRRAGAWRAVAAPRGTRLPRALGRADGRRQVRTAPRYRRQGAGGDVMSADVAGVPAVELRDVCKKFGATEIIRGVNLSIPRGERHAIIGPNGAGKTTLFNLISGRFPISSGSITVNGQSIADLAPQEINRLGLSRSFQITSIFPRMSVFENIRCGLLWSQGYRYSFWHLLGRQKALNAAADQLLERLKLSDRRNLQAGLLSYAEQRALEIGITIAGGAEIILLDEPTAGMSHSETDSAVALIRSVSEGKTLIMVEHDMSVVFGLADRITVLVYGEVIASDAPTAIRGNAAVQEAYLGTVAA